MSAGAFERTFYAKNNGDVAPIRVQPETLSLTIGGQANSAPTGPADAGVSRVRVSGGRRKLGTVARKVYITWTGAPPTGYKPGGVIAVPVMIPAHFEAYIDPPDQTGTYLATACRVIGSSPEGGRR